MFSSWLPAERFKDLPDSTRYSRVLFPALCVHAWAFRGFLRFCVASCGLHSALQAFDWRRNYSELKGSGDLASKVIGTLLHALRLYNDYTCFACNPMYQEHRSLKYRRRVGMCYKKICCELWRYEQQPSFWLLWALAWEGSSGMQVRPRP